MSIRVKIYALLTPLLASATMLFAASEYEESSFQPASCCNCGGKFTFRADLLYWKPHISCLELDFGKTTISQTVNEGVTTFLGSEYDADPHFKWNAGFRVAAGYQFCGSELELGVLWTHFQDSGNRSNHSGSDNSNRTKLGLKFNQLDLVVGYNAPSCDNFHYRPYLGVRGAKIDTHLKARLFTTISLPEEVFALESRYLNDKQRYTAVGPLLGLQGEWGLCSGFSLYGNVAASVLYGRSTVHQHDFDFFTAPISQQFITRTKKQVRNWDCNIDLGLGVRYDTCICDAYRVSLLLGLEHHEYFNQARLSADRGDLSFDGVIFSLSVNL